MHACAKFDKPRSILCLVIILTWQGLPTDGQTNGPTDICKVVYPHFVEGGHNNRNVSQDHLKARKTLQYTIPNFKDAD